MAEPNPTDMATVYGRWQADAIDAKPSVLYRGYYARCQQVAQSLRETGEGGLVYWILPDDDLPDPVSTGSASTEADANGTL